MMYLDDVFFSEVGVTLSDYVAGREWYNVARRIHKEYPEWYKSISLSLVGQAYNLGSADLFQAMSYVLESLFTNGMVRILPALSEYTARYKQAGQKCCPICFTKNMQSTGDSSQEGDTYLQGMECLNCGSNWTEQYTFQCLLSVKPKTKESK